MSNYTFLIQPNTLVQKWKAIQCPEATARICQGSNSKTLKINLMENKNNNSKLRCSLTIFSLGIKHFKSPQIKGVKMARHFWPPPPPLKKGFLKNKEFLDMVLHLLY